MKRITASSKNIFVKDKLESILMLFMINYVWLKKNGKKSHLTITKLFKK
jgi:recombinational DNA repair protein (RecF pathway)